MQAHRFSPITPLIALLAIATPLRADEAPTVSPVLERMNEQLAQMGSKLRVTRAEFLAASSASNGNPVGITIVANDREFWTPSQWAPNDARRNADGTNIRYLVDLSDGAPNGGLISAQTEAAIDRAMNTWNVVDCARIPIVKVADDGTDPDLVDGLLGYGTVGTPHLADIVHAGWMPPSFFDLFLPGGGTSFLAVTFGTILLDTASDNDINHDRKFDTGQREIYYNNYFTWGIDADPPIADVESVALHEAGHGLSHGHFGFIFTQNGSIHVAPFAVMNSVLFERNHALQGTDIGSHCSNWGDWPNR